MKTLPLYLVALTAAFVALDVAGEIDWSVWQVTLPLLIALGFEVLGVIIAVAEKDKK